MKKQLLIVFMSSLISALSYATDCQHSPENYICPGDSIVTESGRLGTALGVNPYTHMIAYEYHFDTLIVRQTKPVETIFVTYGCSFGICVGDSIISPETNDRGTVTGVNLYTGMVSFEIKTGANYYTILMVRDPRTLASSKFCEKYGSSERSAERFPFKFIPQMNKFR